MLAELGSDLKKILLAGIGAVAVTAEKGEEIVKELVKKGEITLEQGKVLNEELKHKLKASQPCRKTSLNVEKLSPEEREELKRKLEELEKRNGEEADK